jgi:hypothetical protein
VSASVNLDANTSRFLDVKILIFSIIVKTKARQSCPGPGPGLTQELKLTIGQRTAFLILLNIGSLIGYWSAGAFSEKIGRRRSLALFAVGAFWLFPSTA